MFINGNDSAAVIYILIDIVKEETVALVADNDISLIELAADFGECLRHTACQNNNAFGMKFLETANSLSCFSVAFCRYRA